MQKVFAQKKYHLLGQTYQAKNELRAIFEANLTEEKVQKELKNWITKVEVNALRYFFDFVKKYLELIIPYLPYRLTTSVVEGIIKKSSLLKEGRLDI